MYTDTYSTCSRPRYNYYMRSERKRAVELRSKGKTYAEIQKEFDVRIPKSTLSNWCSNVRMSNRDQERIAKMSVNNLKKGRQSALERWAQVRKMREITFKHNNVDLFITYDTNLATRKIALAMLYVAEGHKHKSAITFGNSDVDIIRIFLKLLRTVYILDETKFRATVQCRADQNIDELKYFWNKVTKISLSQFSKTQIDKRTIGKPTKRTEYKGVCRIDYYSAYIDKELKYIARTIENR